MERIKKLNMYQKGVLILLAAMFVIFTAVYFIVSSKVGFKYNDVILQPRYDNGITIYEGRIKRKDAVFNVTEDKTVTFSYGDKIYGPYTAVEDPTAIPKDFEHKKNMTGVELREGDKVIFRGAVIPDGGINSDLMLIDEEGFPEGFDIIFSDGYNTYDGDGNIVDEMKPSATTIIELMSEPELTSNGDWQIWFYSVVLSVITAVSILFVDELFRWNLSFQIRNAERAEPSEWEIAGRYIGWTAFTVISFVAYVVGLTI